MFLVLERFSGEGEGFVALLFLTSFVADLLSPVPKESKTSPTSARGEGGAREAGVELGVMTPNSSGISFVGLVENIREEKSGE